MVPHTNFSEILFGIYHAKDSWQSKLTITGGMQDLITAIGKEHDHVRFGAMPPSSDGLLHFHTDFG